jgi:hypothetical protein
VGVSGDKGREEAESKGKSQGDGLACTDGEITPCCKKTCTASANMRTPGYKPDTHQIHVVVPPTAPGLSAVFNNLSCNMPCGQAHTHHTQQQSIRWIQ